MERMYAVTRRSLAASAADRWEQQYSNPGSRWVARKLRALGSNPPQAEVDRVIGNDSWTTILCCECGERVEAAIVFDVNGGEYSHEVCLGCLRDAVHLCEQAASTINNRKENP